jgi:hypothetical protein
MDRGITQDDIDLLSTKIESTIEIIMEHLRDSEDRLDAMERQIKEIKNAI